MNSRDDAGFARCFGCGGLFPDINGPMHRYMESTPGCWAAYGEVLARQYNDARYAIAGQMTVDAYAVQHPGTPSPQSIQSVALHLMSLCLTFEHGVATADATQLVAQMANDKRSFVWLRPPASVGDVNVAHVHAAATAAEHVERVRQWAASAWRAWSAHHATIREWLPAQVARFAKYVPNVASTR